MIFNTKKGQLSTFQIVTIILSILGLVIAIGLFLLFSSSLNTSSQICHLSVLTRATSTAALQSFIPLKCTTGKICLTADSNSQCADSFAGETGVQVIKLPSDYQSAILTIDQTSADAMYNCWSNMGEGKLDLFSNFFQFTGLSYINLAFNGGGTKPYCVVCSRIAIDPTVTNGSVYGKDSQGNIVNPLKGVNVYSYMQTNSPAGQSLTYLQLFTDDQVKSYPVVSSNLLTTTIQPDLSDPSINTSGREIAFVFMQIKAPTIGNVLTSLAKTGAVVAGGSLLTGPTRQAGALVLSTAAKAPVVTLLAVGLTGGVAATNDYMDELLLRVIVAHLLVRTQKTAGTINGGVGTSQGCSLIQAVPYTPQAINEMCGAIEGNP